MPLRPNMLPADFLDIFRRRIWWIVFSFLSILFAATVYCVITPDLYQSSSKILIIPPAVAEGAVQSSVNMNARDRLKYIELDILSRSRLLDAIKDMGIEKLGFTGMSNDDMVDRMRRRVDLEVDRDYERNLSTFILSFEHQNPQVAKDVATRLASFFIEENIKNREAVTQGTSKFLGSQVDETRRKLEQQEEKMKRYKLQFGGELPQQEQVNLNRLTRLQDQIKNNSEAMARLADRKVYMETQISGLESKIQAAENRNPWDTAGSSDPSAPGSLLSELAMRRNKLEELKQKYKPLHPAVVQARWEVEQLEAKIAKLRKAAKKGAKGSAGATDPSGSQSATDLQPSSWERTELQRLRDQVASIDLDIVALKRESAGVSRTIEGIQQKMERLPQREQEMVSLSRDYDNLKKSYDELLEKKLKANISMNLEEKQKGERFQVLEPAELPTRPSKPNRLKVLALAMAVALMIGVGGPIGFEMLDPTLRGSKDFKSFFELPILASLPVIQDERYNKRKSVQRAALVGGLVSILGSYVVFLVIHGEKVISILQSIMVTIGGKN